MCGCEASDFARPIHEFLTTSFAISDRRCPVSTRTGQASPPSLEGAGSVGAARVAGEMSVNLAAAAVLAKTPAGSLQNDAIDPERYLPGLWSEVTSRPVGHDSPRHWALRYNPYVHVIDRVSGSYSRSRSVDGLSDVVLNTIVLIVVADSGLTTTARLRNFQVEARIPSLALVPSLSFL